MIATCPRCRARYRIARETIGPLGSRLRCSKCSCVFRVQAPAPAPERPSRVGGPRGRALVVESDRRIASEIAALLSAFGLAPEIVNDGAQGLLGIFRLPPDVAILGADLPGLSAPAIAEIVRRAPHLRGQPLIRVAPPDEPAVAAEFEATYTLPPGEIPAGLAPLLGRLGFEAPAAQPQQPDAAASAGSARPEAGAVPRGAPERAPAPAAVSPRPLQPPAVTGAPPAPHSAPSEPAAPSPGAADALDARGEEFVAAGPPAERAGAEKPRDVAHGDRGGAEPRPPEPEAPPAARVTGGGRPKSEAAGRPMPASGDAAPAPEVAMAERLARIIVADIILYNEEKFAQAVEDGNLEEALRPELQEGLALFKQRIPAEVRAKCDFVREELKRRAALARGRA